MIVTTIMINGAYVCYTNTNKLSKCIDRTNTRLVFHFRYSAIGNLSPYGETLMPSFHALIAPSVSILARPVKWQRGQPITRRPNELPRILTTMGLPVPLQMGHRVDVK